MVCFPGRGVRRKKKKSKKSKNASKRNEVKNEEQSAQPKIKQQQQRKQHNKSRNESLAGDLVELMKWTSAGEQMDGQEEHVDVNVVKMKDGDVTQKRDSDIDPDKKSQTDILEVIQDRKGHGNNAKLFRNNSTLVTEEEGKGAKESSVVEVVGATENNRVPNMKYKGLKEHKESGTKSQVQRT